MRTFLLAVMLLFAAIPVADAQRWMMNPGYGYWGSYRYWGPYGRPGGYYNGGDYRWNGFRPWRATPRYYGQGSLDRSSGWRYTPQGGYDWRGTGGERGLFGGRGGGWGGEW